MQGFFRHCAKYYSLDMSGPWAQKYESAGRYLRDVSVEKKIEGELDCCDTVEVRGFGFKFQSS
jgi:hypothetical protein